MDMSLVNYEMAKRKRLMPLPAIGKPSPWQFMPSPIQPIPANQPAWQPVLPPKVSPWRPAPTPIAPKPTPWRPIGDRYTGRM